MNTLDDIRRPVAEQLKGFEPFFRQQLQSPDKMLAMATNYVFRRKGKQMRPLLVYLAAEAAGGVTAQTRVAATLIELLHNATLVHDDVVDETFQRRGQLSLMGLMGSKVAVLVGDFFLARGLMVAIDAGQTDMLKVITQAVGQLAQGELSQIDHARNLDITEETYYAVIRQKTAVLIEACTRCGAISANADADTATALADYGINLGMAFQIRDDIFDYTPGGLIGKPSLNDIKEQKLTLPLIAALRNATDDERRHLMALVRREPKADNTAALALDIVRRHGGIDYASERIGHFTQQAMQSLQSLQPSEATQSLAALLQYNQKRNS